MDENRRDFEDMVEVTEGTDVKVEKEEIDHTLEDEEVVKDGEVVENPDIIEETIVDQINIEAKGKKKGRRGKILSYIAVALIASILGGVISPYILINYIYPDKFKTEEAIQPHTQETYIIEGDAVNAISIAAKKAMSSVVGITTVEIKDFGFLQQEVDGVGSGVIVDKNGYILTNSHVIGDGRAKEINVLFEDGSQKPGQVLWFDPSLDLAVVKVDATNLPQAVLGDSDELEIGEVAIAIGNPLGLEFQRTVTSGIISGLNRSIRVDQYNVIEDLIQTDASINPGNSGGPLLNSKGEVIGINTAKIKTAEGLGFAIPINIVKPIIEQVIEHGTYKTVFIGIAGVDVEIYERRLGVDLQAEDGVVIIQVEPNSPASRADLRNGDIITKIDDKEIKNMNQIKKALHNYKQGDRAVLSIIRNGKTMEVELEFTHVR